MCKRRVLIAVVALVGVLASVGSAATSPAYAAKTAANGSRQHKPCIANDQIVARFRQTAARHKDTAAPAMGDLWDQLADCGQIDAITRVQAGRLVELFYAHSDAALLSAIRQQRSGLPINKMIANTYTRAPDRVQNDPHLAAVTSTALIAVNRSYNVAYRDLAFATIYHAANPAMIRGYLQHFGCFKTDAVWAALTQNSRQFIPGDVFPAATQADDWDQSDLTKARLALLQDHKVPTLSVDCPLSDAYVYNHHDVMDYLLHKGKSHALAFGTDLAHHAKTWGDTLHQALDTGMKKAKKRAKHDWSTFYHALPLPSRDKDGKPSDKANKPRSSDTDR